MAPPVEVLIGIVIVLAYLALNDDTIIHEHLSLVITDLELAHQQYHCVFMLMALHLFNQIEKHTYHHLWNPVGCV